MSGALAMLFRPKKETAKSGVSVNRMTKNLIGDSVLGSQNSPYLIILYERQDDAVGSFLKG